MKSALAISLFFCVSCVVGDNSPYYAQEPNYSFKWEVKDDYSGQDFGQEEARKGYNTDGEYSVLLPDGRKQIVTYKVADPSSGYVADVRYEGDQRPDSYAPAYPRPSYSPKVQPSYKVPVRPAFVAIRPVPSYPVTTPVATHPIFNYRHEPAPYVPKLEPFVVKPAAIQVPKQPPYIPIRTTTTTEAAPVYVPGSVKKEKMKLTPKLNAHPNDLVNELFYGDLSKEKFKGDKKVHE